MCPEIIAIRYKQGILGRVNKTEFSSCINIDLLLRKKKTPILLHVHRYEMILYSNTERDLKFCREAAALVKPLRESDCFGRGSCQRLTSLTCAAAVPYVSPALKSLGAL